MVPLFQLKFRGWWAILVLALLATYSAVRSYQRQQQREEFNRKAEKLRREVQEAERKVQEAKERKAQRYRTGT